MADHAEHAPPPEPEHTAHQPEQHAAAPEEHGHELHVQLPEPTHAVEAPKDQEEAPVAPEVPKVDKTRTSITAPPPTNEGEKRTRRFSMFAEAQDTKGLFPPPVGGDLTTTLQTFFTHQSHSAENVVLKPLRRPKLIFENTYRLEPSKPFSATRTETLIQATLVEMLENVKYNSKTVNTTCGQVAEKIRSRLLGYRFDRYKLIIMVNIGSMTRQGIHIGFRSLWDPNRDSYAYSSFKNISIYAVACVYAIYYE